MKKEQYKVIVKIWEGSKRGEDSFKKWHVWNLLKLVEFLDQKFPNWKWFNVYDKRTKEQIASYTKNNRPTAPRL